MAIIKITKAGKTKASLKSALLYIANEEKITQPNGKKLISSLNCWGNLENIYETMIATKKLYRKFTDNKHSEMYKHIQQAFKPQEVTPKIAHEIGIKWAKKCFGEKGFEICICTHLDKEHIHNHFIINSVNALTGKTIEIHANKTLEELKYISDELCKEYNLFIIERNKFEKNDNIYSMTKKYGLEKKEYLNLTWQKVIYDRIKECIQKSKNKGFAHFKNELKKYNIEVEEQRIKGDLIFISNDYNRRISDETLAKNFADEKQISKNNIEKYVGKIDSYTIKKEEHLSEKKQGFYRLIENLLKAINNTQNIKTKLEFYLLMEQQGWLIKETQTGKAYYCKEQNRYIYDQMLYKLLGNKEYCLKYIEEKLN